MQSFLNKLAKESISKFGANLGELTIVLPNRRAIVFLTEEFKKELTKSSWLPKFYSLEDFISTLGGYVQIDTIDLVFELYEIHKQLEGDKAEPFEDFMGWGTTLLQDFNEIDRYMVDGSELFSFLTEAKALEIWELEEGGLTEFQHKYLRFWTKLGDYYQLFTKKLREKNTVYQGLGFRMVAENLPKNQIDTSAISILIFAGFNALTTAESNILNYFKLKNKALVFYDADRYYLDDKFQEAGNFLRGHQLNDKENFNWISDHLLTDPKRVEIYGVNGNIGQAKLVGNLLTKTSESTAVVLSEEELLIPILEALPQRKLSTNVTMGYPINASPLFSWLESLIALYLNNISEEQLANYYHHDLITVLNHSVNQYFNKNITDELKVITQKITKEKIIFIDKIDLQKLDDLLGIPFFNPTNNSPALFITNLLGLIKKLRIHGSQKFELLTIECLTELEKSFVRLQELIQETKDIINFKSLSELIKQVISNQTVSFVGEPLGGIQIMGVLESRTLDFENVILSSVNEGILPSGKTQNSFIPFDIKKKFDLPSYQEKDAIFAYHFYRLIQRAKNIKILYNTKVDQLQGGERSRFIEQLVHEFKTKNKKSELQEITIAPKPNSSIPNKAEIRNNDKIKKKLNSKLETNLSASALNSLLTCPLDFYYKYALKLSDDSGFDEKVQDNTLGTIVHNSLEDLYSNYLNKILIEEDFKKIKSELPTVLLKHFKIEVNSEAQFGNHKLTLEVAKKFVLNQLNYDLQLVKDKKELIILSVEQSYKHSFTIPNSNNTITLAGKVDRMDSLNGTKRIIDYKTGGVEASDLNYTNLEKLINGSKPKVVQLLLYKYMIEQSTKSGVEVGIISLRKISNGFLTVDKATWKEDFEGLLAHVVQYVNNTEVFEHNQKADYCSFCS